VTPAGPPPGATPGSGQWEVDTCDTLTQAQVDAASGPGIIWVSFAPGSTSTTVAVTPPSPAVLASQAAAELQLPSPTPAFSPTPSAFVNFPEWLWIDPEIWHPYSVTATAANALGSASATATATPIAVVWDMGDSPSPPTVCDGPGTAYDPALPASDQRPSCQHTYTLSSYGQPSSDGDPNAAAFPVTVSVQWQVDWTGSGGSAGTLPTVVTTTRTSLPVEQIQSALCTGSCPSP